jgi:3-phytase
MKHSNYSSKLLILLSVFFCACSGKTSSELTTSQASVVKPLYVTEPSKHDTDDPAIWVNPENIAESLIIGTDKNVDGALYVYDLKGKILQDKVVTGLQRPNNVDIEYGLKLGDKAVDIAVTGERLTHNMRIYSLPDMQPLDGGGIPVFEGETGLEYRDLMGVALYKRPADGAIFAIMGRKTGPTDGTYLWQYLLRGNADGTVTAELVRKFGQYSGLHEIEAIAVDDELGYVYYSDEGVGMRKYHADPEMGNEELAFVPNEGFVEDNEGISIYDAGNGTGYILVSDQQGNEFHIYPREGSGGNPQSHPLLKQVAVSTNESDGSDVSSLAFNEDFPNGLFVAMSDDKTFHLYRWEDIAGELFKQE